MYADGGGNKDLINEDLASDWFRLRDKVRCPIATFHLAVSANYEMFTNRGPCFSFFLYENCILYSKHIHDSQYFFSIVHQNLALILVTYILSAEGNVNRSSSKLEKGEMVPSYWTRAGAA